MIQRSTILSKDKPSACDHKEQSHLFGVLGISQIYRPDKLTYSKSDIHQICQKVKSKLTDFQKVIESDRIRITELTAKNSQL